MTTPGIARRQRATVYDVARQAGVSIKTVSRVVNGSEHVSVGTRQRVLAAVEDLDYMRNSAALSLRTGTADAIGIVVDSIADPFFATLTSIVEESALAAGYSVLIASTGRSADRERGQVLRLARHNISALLLAPIGHDHRYIADTLGDLPVVLIDRGWDLPGFDTVRVHDRTGGRLATEHLVRHGHRRIAFIGDDVVLPTITSRLAGYRDALAAAAVPVREDLVRLGCGEPSTGASCTVELLGLTEPPTAIFSSNPRATQGVLAALHGTGRTDVAVVGFGDFPLAAALHPAVTIVDQDPAPIAAAAADRLFARLGGSDAVAAEIVLPTTIVPRGSGELTPCAQS